MHNAGTDLPRGRNPGLRALTPQARLRPSIRAAILKAGLQTGVFVGTGLVPARRATCAGSRAGTRPAPCMGSVKGGEMDQRTPLAFFLSSFLPFFLSSLLASLLPCFLASLL